MAITNISLAKHLDGRVVQPEDVKVGLDLHFPSGVGGVISHKCVSFDGDKAQFKSTNNEWPVGFEMDFSAPDFTAEDFELLSTALSSFQNWNQIPSGAERSIVHRASTLGYAYCCSYTQASWTQEGLDALREISGGNSQEPEYDSRPKKSISMNPGY